MIYFHKKKCIRIVSCMIHWIVIPCPVIHWLLGQLQAQTSSLGALWVAVVKILARLRSADLFWVDISQNPGLEIGVSSNQPTVENTLPIPAVSNSSTLVMSWIWNVFPRKLDAEVRYLGLLGYALEWLLEVRCSGHWLAHPADFSAPSRSTGKASHASSRMHKILHSINTPKAQRSLIHHIQRNLGSFARFYFHLPSGGPFTGDQHGACRRR